MSDLKLKVLDVIRASANDEMTVDALERVLALPRAGIVGLLKEFEQEGHGRFIVGRGSHPSRFARSASTMSSASQKPSSRSELAPTSEQAKALPAAPPESEEDRTQVLILNREKPFRFIAPANLTPQEAEKISRWLTLIAEG